MEEPLLNIKGPVIVTGCQRSGTTIMTKMICNDFGYSFHQDDEFPPNLEGIKRINLFIKHGISKIAIQSPLLLYMYDDIYYTIPDIHFIGMKRDKTDIINSMRRVNWQEEVKEYYWNWESYLKTHVDHMNAMWEDLKTKLPPDAWTEIEYQSLESHPLFIPKELRTEFTIRQTEINGSKVR